MDKAYELSAQDAKEFFLRSENYSNLELPNYFDFNNLLNRCDKWLHAHNFQGYFDHGKKVGNLNYPLVNNKDGKYAWRRHELIHPVIYVDLVNIICEESSWKLIQNKLKSRDGLKHVSSSSHVPSERAPKKESIGNWWTNHEKETIRNSLTFDVMAETDFTDCYGSLYTHSIAWALHGRETSKTSKDDTLLGNRIDKAITGMQWRESVGIPQGSALMDFLAELVLTYLDSEIENAAVQELPESKYKIIRYRDDYRIFTNSVREAEALLKIVSIQGAMVGFRLNPSKTAVTSNVVASAIKPDKRAAYSVSPVATALQEIITIHAFAASFPNSAVLETRMVRLANYLDENPKGATNDAESVIAVAVDLAISNPRVFPACMGLISRLLELLDPFDVDTTLQAIISRVENMPNNALVSAWLQRLVRPIDKQVKFKEQLCQVVAKEIETLWSLDWITATELKRILNKQSFIDWNVESNQSRVMPVEEFRLLFDQPS